MSTEDVTAEIAAVLAEHRVSHHGTTIVGFTPCRCSCGVDFACPVFQSWEFCDHYHRTHLADLLAARDRRVRAEALREAAEAMFDGPPPGMTTAEMLDYRADRIEADA